MRKMTKIYEAPKAEMIEMQMPSVLMASSTISGGSGASGTGGIGGGL